MRGCSHFELQLCDMMRIEIVRKLWTRHLNTTNLEDEVLHQVFRRFSIIIAAGRVEIWREKHACTRINTIENGRAAIPFIKNGPRQNGGRLPFSMLCVIWSYTHSYSHRQSRNNSCFPKVNSTRICIEMFSERIVIACYIPSC